MDAIARRLLIDAFGAATAALDEELALGTWRWTGDDGTRCYTRQDEHASVMTLVRADGSRSVYTWVGVDLEALT